MGIILIILGILVWYFWATNYNKGKQDAMYARKTDDSPMGCLPWVIALAFIGIGISLLF